MATGGNGHGTRAELTRKARNDCPSCGTKDEWIVPEIDTVQVPIIDQGVVFPGRGIEALILICGHCGFLRLHSVLALEGKL